MTDTITELQKFPLEVDDGMKRTPESLASDLIEEVYFTHFGVDSKSLGDEIRKSGKGIASREIEFLEKRQLAIDNGSLNGAGYWEYLSNEARPPLYGNAEHLHNLEGLADKMSKVSKLKVERANATKAKERIEAFLKEHPIQFNHHGDDEWTFEESI